MCHDSTWDHECDDTSEPCPDCGAAPAASVRVLGEVLAERARQDAKWGEQNHPDVDPVLTGRDGGCDVARMCEEVGIATPTRARANLDGEARLGRATWSLIAVEELAEAVEAATKATQGRAPVDALRTELVQSAAVFVAWIEALDRRALKGNAPTPLERDMVTAVEVDGDPGAWLVTLSCGHKTATRERRVKYACRACTAQTGGAR